MADTADSKSAVREDVRVQVPPRAPHYVLVCLKIFIKLLYFLLFYYFVVLAQNMKKILNH